MARVCVLHVHALRFSGVGRCSLGVAYRAVPAGLPLLCLGSNKLSEL